MLVGPQRGSGSAGSRRSAAARRQPAAQGRRRAAPGAARCAPGAAAAAGAPPGGRAGGRRRWAARVPSCRASRCALCCQLLACVPSSCLCHSMGLMEPGCSSRHCASKQCWGVLAVGRRIFEMFLRSDAPCNPCALNACIPVPLRRKLALVRRLAMSKSCWNGGAFTFYPCLVCHVVWEGRWERLHA